MSCSSISGAGVLKVLIVNMQDTASRVAPSETYRGSKIIPLSRLSHSVVQYECCQLVIHWAHIAPPDLDSAKGTFRRCIGDPRPALAATLVVGLENSELQDFDLVARLIAKANCCERLSACQLLSQRGTAGFLP